MESMCSEGGVLYINQKHAKMAGGGTEKEKKNRIKDVIPSP